MVGVRRALAVRPSCVHFIAVRRHAPPQLRATPTSFTLILGLLNLAAGYRPYDVIVTPNIDADYVNFVCDATSLPPTIFPPFSGSPHLFRPLRPLGSLPSNMTH